MPMELVLSALLSLSMALNIGLLAGFISVRAGAGMAQALLTAGGAAGGCLALAIAAVAAYR
ncbi:hypothetical protein OG233_16160 [Streptomyces sp. NBC_01218]|uniref:hypothetical protein n=1 Tax=Streptomyces sp. NBC_01218 TaxID=2903780 RepID=UPI002E14DBEE|nr:hypothetical protein OG233_16160 [Streptomyces sp. NBC_01218]